MKRILVIDDEASIRNIVALGLSEQGYEVFQAGTMTEGLDALTQHEPQLIILDLGLPDGDGLTVLNKVREWSLVPIVVLTVRDDEQAKVQLLEAGADDYVTKPFSLPELAARIKVALRHASALEKSTPIFQTGDLKVDLSKHEVFIDDKLVRLTVTEYAILRLLVRAAGQVVPQKHLLSEIWGVVGVENPHYIRIYIGHLRKKIEKNPATPVHVITEPGVGYRIR